MLEYFNRDFQNWNLALLANSSPEGDREAAQEFVRAVTTFSQVNPEAFVAPKPFEFRNGAAVKQIAALSSTTDLTEQQGKYLSIMKDGLKLQEDVLLKTEQIALIPDAHHWDVELRHPDAPQVNGQDNPFEFQGAKGRPAIMAYPELKWAGFLSNPAKPDDKDFSPSRVFNVDRLLEQSAIIAEETGSDQKTLLQSVFANAAQRIGLTLTYDKTKEGQFGPDYWVGIAETAQAALRKLVPAPQVH